MTGNLKKVLAIVGIAVGIVLIGVGLFMDVPGSHISSFTLDKYVGGDAYNYIIEAALRGGKISGQMVSNAVYIGFGTVIVFYSAFKFLEAMNSGKENEVRQAFDSGNSSAIRATEDTQQMNDDDLPDL